MRLSGFVIVHSATEPGGYQVRHSEIIAVKQIGDTVYGTSKIEYRSNGGGTCELRLADSYAALLIRIQQAQEEDEQVQARDDQGRSAEPQHPG